MKSLQLRKNKIPYEQIDKGYRKIIELLNKFPFCLTTSCCQGHSNYIGGGIWAANAYITLEVEDEKPFLDLFSKIAPDFQKITGLQLHISKQYYFEEGNIQHYIWRLSYWETDKDPKVLEEWFRKGRKCLERLIQEYQWRNKVAREETEY